MKPLVLCPTLRRAFLNALRAIQKKEGKAASCSLGAGFSNRMRKTLVRIKYCFRAVKFYGRKSGEMNSDR